MRLPAAIMLMIAACKEEPSPPRAGDGSSHLAPVIIVTKSDLPALPDAAAGQPIRCEVVVEKLKRVVAHVDPALALIATTKSPIVLASCFNERWSEPLKECIMTRTSADIAEHACDAQVPDELAQKLLDRLAPGRRLSPQDFLRR